MSLERSLARHDKHSLLTRWPGSKDKRQLQTEEQHRKRMRNEVNAKHS